MRKTLILAAASLLLAACSTSGSSTPADPTTGTVAPTASTDGATVDPTTTNPPKPEFAAGSPEAAYDALCGELARIRSEVLTGTLPMSGLVDRINAAAAAYPVGANPVIDPLHAELLRAGEAKENLTGPSAAVMEACRTWAAELGQPIP